MKSTGVGGSDTTAEDVSKIGEADGVEPEPDAAASASAGRIRGSLRRSQWLAPQRGRPEAGEATDDGQGEDVADPPSTHSRARFVVPSLAVVAALILVMGLSGAFGSSQKPVLTVSAPTSSARPGAEALRAANSPGSTSPSLPSLTSLASAPGRKRASGTISSPAALQGATTLQGGGALQGGGGAQGGVPGSPGPAIPEPIGFWPLDDGSGGTAVDPVGHRNGVAANVTWQGSAAEFNGKNSQITVPESVIETGPQDSFTVAASVNLAAFSAFETAVSQDGVNNSAFYLEYDSTDERWAFARRSVDGSDSVVDRAVSSTVPVLNTWTNLVGVFDGGDDTLQIYVNGQLQGTANDPTPFATSGELVMGRSLYGHGQVGFWAGLISNVRVFNQALTPEQITALGL